MASSTVSLSIDSGPKKGETLECNPGDLIHIGRVVRGNTLAIRDPSISQKHLAVRFLPEVNRWAVTDFGSSNGTYVNGVLISPDDPAPLADGDIIRIGEKTSIVVRVSAPQTEPLPLSRHGRRQRPAKAVSSDEEKVNEPDKIGGHERGRSRKWKHEISQPVVMEQRTRRAMRASARAVSTRVSETKVEEDDMVIVISDSDSAEGAEKEKPLKQNNGVAEEEEPAVGKEKEGWGEDDMDNMTMGEWFDRMEEYLPKEINRVAEGIIAKLRDNARLFDEHVAQISNARGELVPRHWSF